MKALALALVIVIPGSCDSRVGSAAAGDSGRAPAAAAADGEGTARRALVAELRRLADRSIFADSLPIHTDRVAFEDVPSAAVPGLVYHWAMYKPPEIDHGFYSVVAAERAGRLEVLREAPDWGVVTRGWRPADSTAAVFACLELVNTLTDSRPQAAPTRVAEDRAWVDSLPPFVSPATRRRVARALRAAPEATDPSGYAAWTVKLWVLQSTGTTAARRYRCDLPATPSAGPGVAALAAIDSLGPSLLPTP